MPGRDRMAFASSPRRRLTISRHERFIAMKQFSLSETALLVKFEKTRWGLVRLNKKVKADMADRYDADEALFQALSSVINPKFKPFKAIEKLDGFASNTIRAMTGPWADSGYRIVTCAEYDRINSIMLDLEAKRIDLIDELIKHLDTAYSEARAALGPLFDETKVLSADEVRAKFTWSFVTTTIPSNGHRILNISDKLRDRIAEETEARVNLAHEKLNEDLFEKVSSKLRHMVRNMEEYGEEIEGSKKKRNFDNSITTNLIGLADTVRALNVTGDPRLSDVADNIVKRLTKFSPDELRGKVKGDKRTEAAKEGAAAKKREANKNAASELLDEVASIFG